MTSSQRYLPTPRTIESYRLPDREPGAAARALCKALEGPLWEIRLKGKDAIARALYVTIKGRRVVIVRVFVKKTQKTPRREIETALARAREVLK
jgi:phage-related protein